MPPNPAMTTTTLCAHALLLSAGQAKGDGQATSLSATTVTAAGHGVDSSRLVAPGCMYSYEYSYEVRTDDAELLMRSRHARRFKSVPIRLPVRF